MKFLGQDFSRQFAKRFESGSLDRDYLLSLSEEDLKAIFVLEPPNFRNHLALRILIAAQADLKGSMNILHLSREADAQSVGNWVVRHMAVFGDDFSSRLGQLCESEIIDGDCLMSLSKHVIQAIFKLDIAEQRALNHLTKGFARAAEGEREGTGPYLPADLERLSDDIGHPVSGFVGDFPMQVRDSVYFSIVIVGGTGAGKSTLINALLGVADLLPANCMRACISVIIELVFNASAGTGAAYHADVVFQIRSKWLIELKSLCSVIRDATACATSETSDSTATVEKSSWVEGKVAEGVMKLRSVFGAAAEDVILDGNYNKMAELPQMKILGTMVQLEASSTQDMYKMLSLYTDSENHSDVDAKWPLVKKVVMRGPWAILMGGIKLVDAPGLLDDNAARAGVVRQYLEQADAVWVASNIKRAVNDKTTKDLLSLDLRRELLTRGKVGQLCFIATQTDVLFRSEIVQNLKLSEETSLLDCASARNAFTKKRVTEDFF